MKKPGLLAIIYILFLFVSSCINSTVTDINMGKDLPELRIAKKTLEYIANNEVDSLYKVLSEDFFERTSQEDFDLLLENGKRVINTHEYPNDSIVSVSRNEVKMPTGTIEIKEFEFPFLHSNPDSTMTIKVKVINQKIYRLYLGTGIRIIK